MASQLRILLIVDGPYPGFGGTESQVELISGAFLKAGHQVKVLAPALAEDVSPQDQVGGVQVERINYPQIKKLGAIILMIKFGFKMLVERNHYDVIHVHMVKNLAAVLGAIQPLLPSVLAAKISGAWEFDGGLLDPALAHRPLHRLMNHWVRRFDHIQCISQYTQERVLAAGYSLPQIMDVPNAVDTEKFNRAGPSLAPYEGVTVLYAGRLVAVKALDVLLDAWKIVHDEHASQRPRLLLVGDGPLEAELRRQAESLGINASVEFLGRVKDMPGIYKSADIYVQPSYQEGLPNSVMEAMAASLPIVGSNISGNQDLISEGVNGYLVPAGNKLALAKALAALVGDARKRQCMGKASVTSITENYGISTVLQRLCEKYTQKQQN